MVPLSSEDRALFANLYPKARRFAAFVAPAGTDPDDIVQEALTRVLGRGPLGELDQPLSYLRTTILNLARNESRRQQREQVALHKLRDESDPETPEGNLAFVAVLDALQSLPAQTRAAVFLVDVEGYPIAEAAQLVGLSTVATRARVSRARRNLRSSASRSEEMTR